ncbi:MAG TPA: hypothetical protein VMK12_25750 [Anaeromyxobacteraceae bacterium]|nr:hypothetical protein [Anaeromyxobacteraceae bacterium]
MVRYVEIAHAIQGRLRLRVPALRRREAEVTAAARVLAALPGVVEVRGHPFTGSFLVLYDERHLDAERIGEALREAIGASAVVRRGERPRSPRPKGPAPPSAVGKAMALAFRDLNHDLLAATEGSIDLGALLTLAFATFGAGEVVAMRKLPVPPWFNFAWWGFQGFMALEGEALSRVDGETDTQPEESDKTTN